METAMLSPADAMLLGQNNGFGNNGSWIWVLLLAFLWGGNGGFGWGNRGGSGMCSDFIDGSATRAAVNSGFQYNQLDNGIRGIQNGLCDGFYAVNSSLKDAAYGTQGAIKDCCCTLRSELADCCCTTNRNIDALRYDISKGFCDVVTAGNLNTRDILEAQNANTQRILDYINCNEKQALRDRIQTLETSGIVQAQTKNLIETLRPCPIPAYITCSPFQSYTANPYGTTFGAGYGCGCGI
jgi:hypothetical protein